MLGKRKKTVLCLGFFDSLHKGHLSVIEKAKEIAKNSGASVTVFSFSGNLKKVLYGKEERVVYLEKERLNLLKDMGIKNTYFMPVTKKYLSLSKNKFLDFLTKKFNISALVFGTDFRFGKNAEGDAEFIKQYAKDKNIKVAVLNLLSVNDKKVSTTLVKELLLGGEITAVNQLLGRKFSITGKVYKDRGVGTKIGFPTANVKYSYDKVSIKTGVYSGVAIVKGKEYKALINYGTRPTFGGNIPTLEVHLIDFSGNVYNKTITVFFNEFIRSEKKFSDVSELTSQIKKDLQRVIEND